MDLDQWLREGRRAGRTNGALAAFIGVNPSVVSRYRRGILLPGRAAMVAIFRFTDGAVTPNDFYGVQPGGEAPAAPPLKARPRRGRGRRRVLDGDGRLAA